MQENHFKIKRLNDPFSDSVFFVRNDYKKRAFLFDCGKLGRLDNSDILDIGDIFISHTHIDHFIGFDRILRTLLSSDNEIRIFGPKDIIKNVNGKLSAYTWNLIEDYNLEITVIELNFNESKKARFSSKNKFDLEELIFNDSDLDIGDGFRLEYEKFCHRTVSLGYKVVERDMISIDKAKLQKSGFKEGAWLRELKEAILQEKFDKIISPNKEENFPAKALYEKLASKVKKQNITYITDIAPTDDNIARAITFAEDSRLLLIEAVFMNEDLAHASLKNHLTISLSKEIFLKSASEFVLFSHFASRYERNKSEFFAELKAGLDGRIFNTNYREDI